MSSPKPTRQTLGLSADHSACRATDRSRLGSQSDRRVPAAAASAARDQAAAGGPRIVLLRRLHLDLIGIPPTLEEIAACEADPSPQWYEQTVKRLLEDPRHGERWARHWMDVWRYSDWWGLGDQLRNSQKHIWHWRDWIVESLNADTPYDEMVRLMLAADELHPNDLSKLRATGYLARNYFLFNRPQWMDETVEHVSKGFLGLTMNCHAVTTTSTTRLSRRITTGCGRSSSRIMCGWMWCRAKPIWHGTASRAFDGLLEEPTYLYIRGDERNPDKSRSLRRSPCDSGLQRTEDRTGLAAGGSVAARTQAMGARDVHLGREEASGSC